MAVNAHEDRQTNDTLAAIQRFNDAFNRHDVDAVMAAITEDCVFKNTSPPPDGERYQGQAAVRAF
jgi:ketosteroid isomerase-like protein